MNIWQAVKMAWNSILGKKGRSALTILGIFIGIAAVMTIVSIMEGMKVKSMEQFEAMGTNRITVRIYGGYWDEDGNYYGKDYFPQLYEYCSGLKEDVVGVTPVAYANATVVYGTKSTATMEYKYDDAWNVISAPPSQYYGSDQYGICNNLMIAKGRDLAYLDIEKYNQVCVLGAEAAKTFFGTANPVTTNIDHWLGRSALLDHTSFPVESTVYANDEPMGEEQNVAIRRAYYSGNQLILDIDYRNHETEKTHALHYLDLTVTASGVTLAENVRVVHGIFIKPGKTTQLTVVIQGADLQTATAALTDLDWVCGIGYNRTAF